MTTAPDRLDPSAPAQSPKIDIADMPPASPIANGEALSAEVDEEQPITQDAPDDVDECDPGDDKDEVTEWSSMHPAAFLEELGPGAASLSDHDRRQFVTKPTEQPFVVQDYVSLDESLEWRLHRTYWDLRGANAFVAGDVPYVVNNDGRLSEDAAAMLMAQFDDAAKAGTLPDTVRLLELGAGSGVFAKLLLDALQRRSAEQGVDYYDRVVYHITDGSDTMMQQLSTNGLLDRHADRVALAQIEAGTARDQLESLLGEIDGVFHAVFLNYILDNMPARALHLNGEQTHELMLQTTIDLSLIDQVGGADAFETTRQQLLEGTLEDREEQAYMYARFLINCRYDPADRAGLPRPGDLPPADLPTSPVGLYAHSFGALNLLDTLIPLLVEGGFILVSDYGHDDHIEADEVLEFQHYGGSIAFGVNFSQLDAVYCLRDDITILSPATPWNMIKMRLIGREPSSGLQESFRLLADGARLEAINAPMTAARTMIENHQFEAARWKFDEALRLQPSNWSLHDEIAGFLCYTYDRYDQALQVARHGLTLNPLAVGLWNVLGDALYFLERKPEAGRAYMHALQINPKDVRSQLNLANLQIEHEDYGGAMRLLAEALCLDRACTYREMLLAAQTTALQKMAEQHQHRLMRELNRFRGHRNLPRNE